MKSLALAVLLFSTAIEVNTSKILDGTTQTFLSGSRKVAVHRSGDTTTVMVQEGDRFDTVTLTRTEGRLQIGRRNNGVARRFIVVDRPKIIVDGLDLEPHLMDTMTPAPSSMPEPMPEPMPMDGALEAVPMPMVPDTPWGLKPRPMPMPNPTPMPGASRYYVCPKDATVVITPQPSSDGKFRCPVDGTVMKAGVGRGSKYFLLQ